MVVITLGILLFLLIGIGAGSANPNKLKEVREKHEEKIFEIEGVTGVYDDEETGELVVMVEEEKHVEKIPKKLDDVDVRIEVSGKIVALKSDALETSLFSPLVDTYNRLAENRPVFGGISVGSVATGTLGLVVEGSDGTPYILSNAHVLALGNGIEFLPIGTPIIQPGGADGGTSPESEIGKLSDYITINFDTKARSKYNTADAAIGTVTTGYKPGDVLNGENSGFYHLAGSTAVEKGDLVRKSGRTTGVTQGRVRSTNANVKIWYTDTHWANFKDQIVTTVMSQRGDSGSAVDKDGKFVGLVFAGSKTNTIVCKEKYILDPLGIKV